MADQETAHVAALAMPACSPDSGGDHFFSGFRPKIIGCEDNLCLGDASKRLMCVAGAPEVSLRGKPALQETGHDAACMSVKQHVGANVLEKLFSARRTKESKKTTGETTWNPFTISGGRLSASPINIKYPPGCETTGGNAELFITHDVLNQLTTHISDPFKKARKQSTLRNPRSSNKGIKRPGSPPKGARGQVSVTKVPPPSLPSRFIYHPPDFHGDGEVSSDLSLTFSGNNITYAENTEGRQSVVEDTSGNNFNMFRGELTTLNDVALPFPDLEDSKSLSRADSSDDSGCFSNISRQSTTLPSTGNGFNFDVEGYPINERSPSVREAVYEDPSAEPRVPAGLCNACGNETYDRVSSLCRNCKNRFKKEGTRKGTLDEFKAYAQSIAQSVKKILTISPGQGKSDDKLHRESRSRKLMQDVHLAAPDEAKSKSNPETVLHRFKTEIPKIHPGEMWTRNAMNRGVSFDGQFISEPDENSITSPTYWPGNELKSDQSNSVNSTVALKTSDGYQAGKTVAKRSDQPSHDAYFTSNNKGKDGKRLIASDDDKIGKLDKMRKRIIRTRPVGKNDSKRGSVDFTTLDHVKEAAGHDNADGRPPLPPSAWRNDEIAPGVNNLKYRSRVERARTDGDLRANLLDANNKKSGMGDRKAPEELHYNGSKTIGSNAEAEENAKNTSKQENVHALRIARLQLINEGSPVDPPYSAKKAEDVKARKSALIRSATAPYKHNGQKKDSFVGPKSGSLDNTIKPNRSATKLSLRTNKASALRKENSMKDRERQPPVSTPLPSNLKESGSSKEPIVWKEPIAWKEEVTPGTPKQMPKRRSNSYDGSSPVYSKRLGPKRSKSRSAIDSEETKQQQRDASDTMKPLSVRFADFESTHPMKVPSPKMGVKFREEKIGNYIVSSVSDELGHKREYSTDVSRVSTGKELFFDQPQHTFMTPNFPRQAELEDAQIRSSYSDALKYYNNELQSQLYCYDEAEHPVSVVSAKEVPVEIKPEVATYDPECYFYTTDPAMSVPRSPRLSAQLQENYESNTVSQSGKEIAFYDHQDDIYIKETKDITDDTSWYMDLQQPIDSNHILLRRDRSHESKSSTSFHVVTTVKSSHSDVALMRYQGALDHSRRGSIYSETDVDTGVIYHLAKRQTTRAHVPPYHDLTTGASKNIYTMSGDVSTSESSNSAISMKSEVSDSVYTGGFFKNDPFYDNDNGRSSSESSISHIYFEPDCVTKQDSSENDIYTGGVFSSSQNALSLSNGVDAYSTNQAGDALKDGSTNNSTRPPMNRMSRRSRCRPRIDVINVLNTDRAPFGNNQVWNCSNNSSNWFDVDDLEATNQLCPRATVRQSDEPMYTDYDPGMRPEFNTRKAERRTPPVVDFFKYEVPENTSTGFFFVPPRRYDEGNDIWYGGTFFDETHGIRAENRERPPKMIECRRHCDDDDYTNIVCAKYRNTNNCHGTHEDCSDTDSNNNHFEDFYTGSPSYNGASSAACGSKPPESRDNSSHGVYEQSLPKYASSNTYVPGPPCSTSYVEPPNSWANVYGATDATYSTTSTYGQTQAAYSRSGTCLYESKDYGQDYSSPWSDYEPRQSPSSSRLYDDQYGKYSITSEPNSYRPEERDSYFQYISGKSPGSVPRAESDPYALESFLSNQSPSRVGPEIKKVGGIVCRENVVNKEDYAEDVNRDLEPTAFVPFNFRRSDDEMRHPAEMTNSHVVSRNDVFKAVDYTHARLIKEPEEGSYANNRLFDSLGERTHWREMGASRTQPEIPISRETAQAHPFRQHSATQQAIKREYPNKATWMPPDQIPERARGKHVISSSRVGPTVLDDSSNNNDSSATSKVLSAVTWFPYRVGDYVKKWF